MKRLSSESIVIPSGPAIPNDVTARQIDPSPAGEENVQNFPAFVVLPSEFSGSRQTLFSLVIATYSTCLISSTGQPISYD